MPTFALKRIEAVVGKQQFDKLIVDGTCPFDEFEKTMIQYKSEIKTLYAYMNMVANLRSLPETKFHLYNKKERQRNKNTVLEYEFKTKHLRLYCIEQANGKIVVLGGMKSKQKNDESEFRRLKKLYLDSIKK
jgi:hypothetical protein